MRRAPTWSWVALLAGGCAGVPVQGIVRDARTLEPLPGAVVRIGEEQTLSDASGSYRLEADPADEPQQVYVTKAGYLPISALLPIDEDMAPIYTDLELQPRHPPGR